MDGCRTRRWVLVAFLSKYSNQTLISHPVKHAEMPNYQPDLDVPIGLQLWIDLPTASKMMVGLSVVYWWGLVKHAVRLLHTEIFGKQSEHSTVLLYRSLSTDRRGLSIPLVSPYQNSNIEVRIIAGSSCGTTVPVPPVGGCWYLHIKFRNSQSCFDQELRGSRLFFDAYGHTYHSY